MLDAYSVNAAVTANSNIVFNNKKIETGVTAVLTNNGDTIALNRPGIYSVSVHAYGGATSTGAIAIQLYTNENPIERAVAKANTATGAVANLAFSTLISVDRAAAGNIATFNVRYTGDAGTLNIVEVVVTKVV